MASSARRSASTRSSTSRASVVPLLLLLLSCLALVQLSFSQHHHQPIRGYEIGEPVKLQCRSLRTGQWEDGPLCSENGKPVDIRYGIDEFAHCGVMLDYFEDFNRFIELIERNRTWECRVAFAPEQDFFLPLELPIWGVVEPQHIHVNNHFNFVFHALKGRIVGATVYPVRDAFQVLIPGSILTVHGPVKWFRGGSFTSFSASHLGEFSFSLGTVVWVGVLSAASALLGAVAAGTAWYRYYQRPQLMRGLVKLKTN